MRTFHSFGGSVFSHNPLVETLLSINFLFVFQYSDPGSKPSTRSPGRSIMSYFILVGLLVLVFAIPLAYLGRYTFPSGKMMFIGDGNIQ